MATITMKVQNSFIALGSCLVPFAARTFPCSLGQQFPICCYHYFPLSSEVMEAEQYIIYPLVLLTLVWCIFFHLLPFPVLVFKVDFSNSAYSKVILFIWAYNLLVAVFFPFAYNIITDTAEFKLTSSSCFLFIHLVFIPFSFLSCFLLD